MTNKPEWICIVCERELKPAPTELGWVRIRYGQGICFDCIESMNKTRLCILKTDDKQTDEAPGKRRGKMRQYTDRGLWDVDWILNYIRNESESQVRKWGIQKRSAFEWLTYITEELGSLAKAISECEYRGGPKEKVVSEAIQVATLALKIAEMFEQSPPAKGE